VHPLNLKCTISPIPPRRIYISKPASSPKDSTELCATKTIETMISAKTNEVSKQLLPSDKQKSKADTCEKIIPPIVSSESKSILMNLQMMRRQQLSVSSFQIQRSIQQIHHHPHQIRMLKLFDLEKARENEV
jgi:hypothetical protein